LYVHAVVFAGWLVFFFLQSALVRIGNVKLHRRIGWFGVGYAVLLVVIGVATAIVMARFNIRVLLRAVS
jgi:Na+/H+-dicarboxylate symporter